MRELIAINNNVGKNEYNDAWHGIQYRGHLHSKGLQNLMGHHVKLDL